MFSYHGNAFSTFAEGTVCHNPLFSAKSVPFPTSSMRKIIQKTLNVLDFCLELNAPRQLWDRSLLFNHKSELLKAFDEVELEFFLTLDVGERQELLVEDLKDETWESTEGFMIRNMFKEMIADNDVTQELLNDLSDLMKVVNGDLQEKKPVFLGTGTDGGTKMEEHDEAQDPDGWPPLAAEEYGAHSTWLGDDVSNSYLLKRVVAIRQRDTSWARWARRYRKHR